MSAAEHSSPAPQMPQDQLSSSLAGPQSSPAGRNPGGGDGDLYCLDDQEWSGLHEVAMSLYGVMRLLRQHGFDNSTGAEELLSLVHRRFEALLASVRRRLEEEAED
ncbi:MAG TPA: hypothetical protein VLV83_06235 [Acidobacteriota bacterium]|nr:hypothetical protein [Acidobacteriota bacterium]